MRFGQIVEWSSRLHGKLIFLQKCGFTIAPAPGTHTAARLPGAPFSRLGPQNLFMFELLGHHFRISGSNSPLSVPDLALLAAPTGFQGASWRRIPPCQCPMGRSWPCRRASFGQLWRRSVVVGATVGQQDSKDDSGVEHSASEQHPSARRLCEAL